MTEDITPKGRIVRFQSDIADRFTGVRPHVYAKPIEICIAVLPDKIDPEHLKMWWESIFGAECDNHDPGDEDRS